MPTIDGQFGALSDDSIKGVFVRCQKSHGVVMLAFFDSRHAARARDILSVPSNGPLADCVGHEQTTDGSQSWIFCEFISAEKLAEVGGASCPYRLCSDLTNLNRPSGPRLFSRLRMGASSSWRRGGRLPQRMMVKRLELWTTEV